MKVTEVQNILKYWCLELEFTAFTRWFLMLAFESSKSFGSNFKLELYNL